MTFGGFKKPDEEEQKQPIPSDARDRWITLLDDGSFLVDFGEGQFEHLKFHGYDVVLMNGRRQRRPGRLTRSDASDLRDCGWNTTCHGAHVSGLHDAAAGDEPVQAKLHARRGHAEA